ERVKKGPVHPVKPCSCNADLVPGTCCQDRVVFERCRRPAGSSRRCRVFAPTYVVVDQFFHLARGGDPEWYDAVTVGMNAAAGFSSRLNRELRAQEPAVTCPDELCRGGFDGFYLFNDERRRFHDVSPR